MAQPLPPQFCRLTLQKRPPEGGDERSEIVQWTISAKNAWPVAERGGGRCPAAQERLDSGQKMPSEVAPLRTAMKLHDQNLILYFRSAHRTRRPGKTTAATSKTKIAPKR